MRMGWEGEEEGEDESSGGSGGWERGIAIRFTHSTTQEQSMMGGTWHNTLPGHVGVCKNVCEMRDGDKTWHMLYPVVSAESLDESGLFTFYRTSLCFCLWKPSQFELQLMLLWKVGFNSPPLPPPCWNSRTSRTTRYATAESRAARILACS